MATPPVFSAGAVLTAAQMNAVGLWEIKSETIGTGVATYSPGTVFSSDYDAYRVIITGGVASVSNDIRMYLGTSAPANGYYYNLQYALYNGTTPTSVNGVNVANWAYAGAGSAGLLDMVIDIRNPFLSKITAVTSFYNQTTTTGGCGVMHGWLNNTTSFTTFTITPNSGTWTGGTVRVYGYRN